MHVFKVVMSCQSYISILYYQLEHPKGIFLTRLTCFTIADSRINELPSHLHVA